MTLWDVKAIAKIFWGTSIVPIWQNSTFQKISPVSNANFPVCLEDVTIYTDQRSATTEGLEPSIFCSEVRRLIHFITTSFSSLKILIENHVMSTDASLLWQTVSHTLLTTIRNNRDFLCIAFDGTICLASLAKVVLTVSDHGEGLICRAFRSKPFLLFLILTTLSAWIDSHVSIIRQVIRKSRNASR